VGIGGKLLDELVVSTVRAILADESETASTSVELKEARDILARSEAALDQAIDALEQLGDRPSAKLKLSQLQDQVERAQARVDELERLARVTRTVNAAANWDDLSLDGRRELICSVIRSVIVHPGRGPERVEIRTV